MAAEILGTIGFFSMVMVLGVVFLRNRHRERLALIQYGKDSSVFNKDGGKNNTLKFGLLFAAIGAGLLIGSIIDRIFGSEPVGTFSCMFLMGGFALIYYHQIMAGKTDIHINKKYNFKDDDDDDMI